MLRRDLISSCEDYIESKAHSFCQYCGNDEERYSEYTSIAELDRADRVSSHFPSGLRLLYPLSCLMMRIKRSLVRGERLRVVRRVPEAVISVVGTAVFVVGAGTVANSAAPAHRWSVGLLAVYIVLVFVAWLCWNIGFRSRIVIWSGGLEVINGFVRHWLPWSSIDTAESRYDVVIRLKDGSYVRPLATLGSPAGAMVGSRHGGRTVALVNAERDDRSDEPEAPRRRFYRIGLVSLVVIAGLVFLFGLG